MRNLQTEWARLLIASFAEAGVRHVVLSPGSRSTPFVLAAATHPGLTCYDVVDERIAKLEVDLDNQIEEDGPSSKKVKKTEKELTKLRAERDALREKAAKVSALKLKKPKQAKAG